MTTKLTTLLGIKHPILQGAMAWISDAQLVAAVGNAGGAGVIATGGRTTQWVREQIQMAKSLTDKPFGVNLMLMDPEVEEKKHLLIEEKVSFVTLGAGNPVPHIESLHTAGIKVIPVVPNLKLAKRVANAGVDALVIEGMEAGGHIGNLTTMALMTQVLPEIDIPVIVAGGIVNAKGVAAALIMGAAGVQMGTRFYASKECSASEQAKLSIVNAIDTDSETTGDRKHQVRGLKNALTQKYHAMVAEGKNQKELMNLIAGTSKKAPIDGDTEWGFVQAGQSLTEIKNILSCDEIISGIMTDVPKIAREFANRF